MPDYQRQKTFEKYLTFSFMEFAILEHHYIEREGKTQDEKTETLDFEIVACRDRPGRI